MHTPNAAQATQQRMAFASLDTQKPLQRWSMQRCTAVWLFIETL
jgi:hypothetical protein